MAAQRIAHSFSCSSHSQLSTKKMPSCLVEAGFAFPTVAVDLRFPLPLDMLPLRREGLEAGLRLAMRRVVARSVWSECVHSGLQLASGRIIIC